MTEIVSFSAMRFPPLALRTLLPAVRQVSTVSPLAAYGPDFRASAAKAYPLPAARLTQ